MPPTFPEIMPAVEEIFTYAYTHLMGLEWFFAFWVVLMVSAIYIQTRSFGPTFMVFIVCVLALGAALPGGPFNIIFFFAVTIGITYVAYRFFVEAKQ